METRHYVAVMYRGTEGYGVVFPDLPGCTSYGKTLQHAVLQAEEALAGHIGLMVEDRDQLPEPTSLDRIGDVMDHSEPDAGRYPIRVEIPAKWVRINMSMAETLIARVDREAKHLGMSRSGFLAEAARRMLGAQTI
ncbi:MAG: type II toxin-antitoxin system HicB family antitoxin [Magnetococcus sp. DMHC-8]